MSDHPTTPIRETVERVDKLRLAIAFEVAGTERDFKGYAAEAEAYLGFLLAHLTALQAENDDFRSETGKWSEMYHALLHTTNAELATLRAENARLREDAARLDWLEASANGIPVEIDAFTKMRHNPDGTSADQVFITKYDDSISRRIGQGLTIRAAIDAARTPTDGAPTA